MTIRPLTFADAIVSNVKAWPEADIILDRITDRIEAPIPASCREFLCYVTGANMVHDRLGEAIALGKLPATATVANIPVWQQVDQARYELVKDRIIARGTQPDGQNYSRFRMLTDHGGARMLAAHDARRLEDQGGDGIFIDNFDTSPDRSFGSVDEGEHYPALAAYIRTLRGGWAGCSIWVNPPQPHVFRNRDGSYAQLSRLVNWLSALGVNGIYYEGYKHGRADDAEKRQIESALSSAVLIGMAVCVGKAGASGNEWEPLYNYLSNNGVAQGVYRSL